MLSKTSLNEAHQPPAQTFRNIEDFKMPYSTAL